MTANIDNALAHIRAAMRSIELEAYRGMGSENMQAVKGFTIAEELKRIDGAIGPTGESMFARMADNVIDCHTELQAALEALSQ